MFAAGATVFPFLPLTYFSTCIQGSDDLALRPRGRPRKDSFPWRKHLLGGDARSIKRSDSDMQYVFTSLACRRQHLRIMLPCSVTERSLTCKLCSNNDYLRESGMAVPSTHERDVYHSLNSAALAPPFWAAEAAIFTHTGNRSLSNCKADLVFFDSIDVSDANLKNALAVFIDGEQHFSWFQAKSAQGLEVGTSQRDTDATVSVAAAAAGFKLLRICYKDKPHVVSLIQAAWVLSQQTSHGFVVVSRRWNSGAHREATVEVRCA